MSADLLWVGGKALLGTIPAQMFTSHMVMQEISRRMRLCMTDGTLLDLCVDILNATLAEIERDNDPVQQSRREVYKDMADKVMGQLVCKKQRKRALAEPQLGTFHDTLIFPKAKMYLFQQYQHQQGGLKKEQAFLIPSLHRKFMRIFNP